jgi:hypothetical protein
VLLVGKKKLPVLGGAFHNDAELLTKPKTNEQKTRYFET